MAQTRLAVAGPLALLALCPTACSGPAKVRPRAAEEVSRGYAHLRGGDAERAAVAFEHALEFDPLFPEAHNGLGVVERRRGRTEAARLRFEEALALDPDFAEAHVNLGESLLALGEPDRALGEFHAALEVDPDLVDARLDLARALLHRGRSEPARRDALWGEARRQYLHLLESDPALADAWHDLAFMDYEQRAFARAEEEYRKAADLEPAFAEALHGLCLARVRLGRCRDGAEACRRCLAAAPRTERCERSLAAALACAR